MSQKNINMPGKSLESNSTFFIKKKKKYKRKALSFINDSRCVWKYVSNQLRGDFSLFN